MSKKVRIGIDVGGTFTDAVIIDNDTFEVLAKHKIPTTHVAGVAQGVVDIIKILLEQTKISPEDVVFIAHGTTQATNALLEGDVASIGIIGMATGMDARSAKNETKIESIELAPGKFLKCSSSFIDSKELSSKLIDEAIDKLTTAGSQVIVASEAFSVDNPTNENTVTELAKSKGLYATGGHEISQLYGLKMRTRTAVVNASLIPKMMETANMTESAVKETNIASELMIMRCDGGVMSIEEVKKRPILTMLSGLAAGVAGALMYEKVSDGIFFEAGGTSVDISVIKNGKVMIKYAQVGGHKTYLQSLDVRTLGVAGGSMIRVRDKKIADVGPRSAHIAGLEYESFAELGSIINPKVKLINPRADDPVEYAILSSENGKDYSYTLAGAAMLLGYVPQDDYAYGVMESTQAAWQALGEHLGITAKEAAGQVVKIAMEKLEVVIDELVHEYELDRSFITLVGGGGSGSVIVNPLAEKMGFQSKIAENAPYISTIGVALAMVKEQIERTIANPTEDDIKKIRAQVIEQIEKSGAKAETIDVSIEIDSQKNILRAIATGATELRQKNLTEQELTPERLKEISAEGLGTELSQVQYEFSSGRWNLFNANTTKKMLFGLIKTKSNSVAVIDREGIIRLRQAGADYIKFEKQNQNTQFEKFVDKHTTYSDANATIPKVFIFYKEKMLDLTGMQTSAQLYSILDIETEHLAGTDEIIAVAYK